MSDVIAPTKTVTFTVTKVPNREAEKKTLRRLMRMQPHIQRGLRKLAKQRARKDNRPHQRAGKIWVSRVKTTKLTNVEAGESFTLNITPQIMDDIRSVEQFLEAKSA